jgi:hypothetical protein
MSESSSIFDADIDPTKVTRNATRRNAVIIPLKKGQEMASKMKDLIPKENIKEEQKGCCNLRDLDNA